MKESFVRKSDAKEIIKGRKLYCDIFGIRHYLILGYYYFLLLIDDAIRTTWVKLLKDKLTGTILLIPRELLDIIEIEIQIPAAIIRANNRKGEFGQAF